MKKYILLSVCAAGLLGLGSCSDYLDTGSKSVVDGDFVFSNSVTARAAMDGVYEQWRQTAGSHVFGDGLFYASDIAGSDIMRHPEKFSNQPGRHYPETFYQNGTYAGSYGLLSYMKEGDSGSYAYLYSLIGKANAVATAIEKSSGYAAMMKQTAPTPMSQLYGEAVAMRATAYRELIKYFGDVPFQNEFGKASQGLASRDSIYDVILAELQKVEPLMYPLGKAPDFASTAKNYFSKTYVDGLIGRIALEAGGYQTRRNDITPMNGEGQQVSIERFPGSQDNNGATYGRRSDWKKYIELAKTYFKKAIDEPGTAVFHATDPRAKTKAGQMFDNPYQYFFQQMMDDDNGYADESIYEYPEQQGIDSDTRTYALGRPSNGGSTNSYPCKDYGQGRINPAFYYGMFDPNDKRRDVAITCTGSDGKGYEKLIPFVPNSKSNGGGLSCNKWDENRLGTVYKGQRRSGVNGPYMRLSEIYLGYAEACAVTGDEGEAKKYLELIRDRAFGSAAKANTDAFIQKEGSLYEAIIDERGFEFAGEGDRRWTLIRTGLLNKKVKALKDLTNEMIEGLKTKGYFKFANGNVISDYIFTKSVDAKSEYGYRLTTETPAGKENDPVLYPGWRGQRDDWESEGCNYKNNYKTNLAIKGLFSYIDPNGEEAKELEADGYKKVNWGKDIVNNADEYYKYEFYDYDYVHAPIYLWPFTPNVLTTGGFLNGYGFSNE